MNGKPRHPRTEHEAIALSVGYLSESDIKDATGHSVEYLRQCGDPDVPGKRLHFIGAAKLDARLIADGKHAVFTEAFGAQVTREGERLTGIPAHDAQHPVERTSDAVQTAAELLGTTRRASHPDSPGGVRYTPNEAAEIRAYVLELFEHGTAILKDVEAHGTEGHLKAVS